MRGYIKIDVVNAETVDKLLSQGWEIIETTKKAYPEGGSSLNYHVGLPAKAKIESLVSIIRQFEKYGLKEKLFEAAAEEFEENLDDYEPHGGFHVHTSLTQFMEEYEEAVNDKKIKYYKKSVEQDYDFKF